MKTGTLLATVAFAGIAAATSAMAGTSVGVNVSTPGVNVQVGTPHPPAPPAPPVTVVERERVIVREVDRHDNGKHKGHYKKKHKKHKKHDD